MRRYTDLKGKNQPTNEKTTYCKSDDKHKEQQKDKHEGIKKGVECHRMWGRKVRNSRLFFLECV